ncbi:hypothetical protein KC878_00620 [Candidatus Saccharibacteria bacterium]|nr:hypothetical protein [Candidatus Saccharibacteria bacterium]MCB9821601.1 hypothetical protein [Candidatus Nomurabacteria bacterium]
MSSRTGTGWYDYVDGQPEHPGQQLELIIPGHGLVVYDEYYVHKLGQAMNLVRADQTLWIVDDSQRKTKKFNQKPLDSKPTILTNFWGRFWDLRFQLESASNPSFIGMTLFNGLTPNRDTERVSPKQIYQGAVRFELLRAMYLGYYRRFGVAAMPELREQLRQDKRSALLTGVGSIALMSLYPNMGILGLGVTGAIYGYARWTFPGAEAVDYALDHLGDNSELAKLAALAINFRYQTTN